MPQAIGQVHQVLGLITLEDHHPAAVVVQRRLEHAEHRQGLAGPAGGAGLSRELPHRGGPQPIPQLHQRQQHHRHKRCQRQLQGQQARKSVLAPAHPSPQQQGQGPAGRGQGHPGRPQQLSNQGGHLGGLNQRQPQGPCRQAPGQQRREQQAQPPCPATAPLGRQGYKQARRRRYRQPVAGQLGGGRREKQQHRQQPAGGEALQRVLRRQRLAQAPQALGQPQQQQGRDRQAGDHQHRPKEPPGRLVVVHHRGEALQIVVAKKALPERLSLHQQRQAIPGQRHQGGECQPRQGPQPRPQPAQIRLQPAKQQQREPQQHHRHRPLGQHRQPQHQPGLPPAAPAVGVAAPAQQQAEPQATRQQGITHGDAAPHQRQGREAIGQGRCQRRGPLSPGALGPAQQRLGQAQHQRHAGQGRGQPRRPGAQGVPSLLPRQGIQGPHQPIHQRRLVIAG